MPPTATMDATTGRDNWPRAYHSRNAGNADQPPYVVATEPSHCLRLCGRWPSRCGCPQRPSSREQPLSAMHLSFNHRPVVPGLRAHTRPTSTAQRSPRCCAELQHLHSTRCCRRRSWLVVVATYELGWCCVVDSRMVAAPPCLGAADRARRLRRVAQHSRSTVQRARAVNQMVVSGGSVGKVGSVGSVVPGTAGVVFPLTVVVLPSTEPAESS